MAENTSGWSEPEEQTIREQLRRVLECALFAHAERLGRFLQFVVDETLAGRADRLNQYAIAIDVFDRDESFDPSIDAIVRVEAGRLRSKLLEYYDELGRNDRIRIELPKRSYAAKFQRQSAAESSDSLSDTEPGSRRLTLDDSRKVPRPTAPTIAVMPFVNMSPDPEQDYFADGVTEDLITDLSRLPGITVISRQSTFSYKGATVTVQQVCDELGANIVLEGSVRKVGHRLRINAQLIEGSTGQHLWAQRYDRDLGNIFEIQDEVNRTIVSALSLQLSDSQREQIGQRDTEVIDAYDYVMRGMKESHTNTMEGSARARYCFERALQLDSGYATAYARLALNYVFRWIVGWSKTRNDSIDKGLELARKAVALDNQLALAHAALGWAQLWQGQHDEAIDEGRFAIELDPSDVVALERLALSLIFYGDAASSLPLIEKAKQLNPKQTYNFSRGIALFAMRNYTEATALLQIDFDQNPNFIPSGLYLAASQALAGNKHAAAASIAGIRRVSPDYALSTNFRSHFKRPEDREHLLSGLRLAGLS